jgi:hypothetical protein
VQGSLLGVEVVGDSGSDTPEEPDPHKCGRSFLLSRHCPQRILRSVCVLTPLQTPISVSDSQSVSDLTSKVNRRESNKCPGNVINDASTAL